MECIGIPRFVSRLTRPGLIFKAAASSLVPIPLVNSQILCNTQEKTDRVVKLLVLDGYGSLLMPPPCLFTLTSLGEHPKS